jgi:stage II sporulation protein D
LIIYLKRLGYKVGLLIILLALCGTVITPSVHYAQGLNNEIRVALYIDMGKYYRETVPVLSVSSDSGLELLGETGAFVHLNGALDARFSLDQYFLIATETREAAAARSISHQLLTQGFPNVITQHMRDNQVIYRVIATSESSEAALMTKKQEIKQRTDVDTILAGPYRVQAGSFPTVEEAQKRLEEIQSKNFLSYIVQARKGKEMTYQVWVGDGLTAAAQTEVQLELQKQFKDISFQLPSEQEYVIMNSAPIFNTQGEQIPYYWISPEKKLTIATKKGSTPPIVTVEERYNRSYRGTIELSRYQNKFTVVNVLPLEHYLYSVVGTEMSKGWPLEALKTQAVMSRNYAYMNIVGKKYGMAHVSDTTFDQAYHGYKNESPDIQKAVDATRGELLTYKGNPFSTFYYSNAGGMTADGREVWGNAMQTHNVTKSNDKYPETIAKIWYRVEDKEGKFGYVHSDYVTKTSLKSKSGYPIGTINTPTLNYRSGPSTDHKVIGSLKQGDQVIIFEERKENNSYSWISGPFNALETVEAINNRSIQNSLLILSPIVSLQILERGPSGRVLKMEANGIPIMSASPDAHRSIFKENGRSLRSTKFEVESMGSFSTLGAGGKMINFPKEDASSAQLFALQGGNGNKPVPLTPSSDQFAIVNKLGSLRIVSKAPTFRFHGFGYGHGLGASQWGIRALATEGYDYRQILKHYFHKDIVIEKRWE